MSLPVAYLLLAVAVVFEVVATSALLASQQFTRIGPTVLVVIGYAGAILCLGFIFRVIPMGLAYAIWSGMGILLISTIGWVVFGQRLDLPAVIGLVLIVAGVVIVNVFSKAFHP